MREIKVKVFKFDELSEESKEKAIEVWYSSEDYCFLEDDILSELEFFDEEGIFSNVKLSYSLSWSQGDGLSFSSDIDLEKFIDKIYEVKIPNWKKRALLTYINKVTTKWNTGHYCSCHESDVTSELSGYDERERLECYFKSIFEHIQQYYLDTCKQLEKYGYSVLEYRMDNKEFSENCECNDYEFYEDGKMI